MASKLVLVVALLAASQASAGLINGVIYRDGRAYAITQASGTGPTRASSNVHGGTASAFGSSDGGAQLARDGFYYQPGQAYVQTQATDGEVVIPGVAKAYAPVQTGAYYSVPDPATVVTYQKFAAPSEIVYNAPGNGASSISSAISDGNTDLASTSVQSSGDGVAVSDALTPSEISHAQVKGNGFGVASAQNKYNQHTASTSAKTQGAGSVYTSAKNYGVPTFGQVPTAVPAIENQPSVVDAKIQSYVPKYTANVAPTYTHSQKPISWRFGTYYDAPQVNSAAPSYAKAQANANQGYASANANANEGYGALKYSGFERESAYESASVNAKSGYGAANSDASLNGRGDATSSANINAGGSSSKAAANTGSNFGYSRINANTNTSGSGSAKSYATGRLNYKHAESSVSSSPYGYANANANSA